MMLYTLYQINTNFQFISINNNYTVLSLAKNLMAWNR